MAGKRRSFSLNEKRSLLEAYDKLPKTTQREASAKLGIPQATLSSLIKHRWELMAARGGETKRRRPGKAPLVEAALVKWIDNARSQNAPLNGTLVKKQAEILASSLGEDNFKVSVGWFARFKKRENIVFKQRDDDAEGQPPRAAVPRDEWLEQHWITLRQNYSEENIWNADETRIYFRALPDGTPTSNSDHKGGEERSKARITALFACSAAGEKKELFVIGQRHSPHCFKHVRNLPVRYAANSSAWMTRALFTDWLKDWDHKLGQERRKILLLVDNCAAHNVKKSKLRNIRLEFLPKDSTSHLQPCEQGITKTTKARFRKEIARSVLRQIDDGNTPAEDIAKKISLLDAVVMLQDAWADFEAATIRDCWRKGGLDTTPVEETTTGYPPVEVEGSVSDDSTSVSEEEEDIITEVQEPFGASTSAVCCKEEEVQEPFGASASAVCCKEEEEDEKEEPMVPSRAEMRNALCILKTGLLHVGFKNFDLLHRFEKEVNLVLDNTLIRGPMDELVNF